MSNVILRDITVSNWQECSNLKVRDEQARFVPTNLYSIAEAQFYPQAVPLAIYDSAGRMVGFVLYGVEVASGQWKVFRLMIDQAHQGQGYGRAAMEQVLERLSAQPGCDEVFISYQDDNQAARRLYASLGFVEQGLEDGVVRARLKP